ncbi:putative leucine-rich repeat receptor-like serine/threonine-protein kinase [Dorcoceras hygrometricum]|uniref:Putative leucine-rich repeat receptor-like serine/threonine-protein kinase n=1 Tax=Dorcoceras hygrometricum TaxID=472368 RepID=A0A2Z7ADS0_9LAMI|nr:putative leucine-rich repeat receptor-like serine/threonine-protein kinase [Dorcoceras hygrometricum]
MKGQPTRLSAAHPSNMDQIETLTGHRTLSPLIPGDRRFSLSKPFFVVVLTRVYEDAVVEDERKYRAPHIPAGYPGFSAGREDDSSGGAPESSVVHLISVLCTGPDTNNLYVTGSGLVANSLRRIQVPVLPALSVIPRGSWGDVARRFTMIRWIGSTTRKVFFLSADRRRLWRRPPRARMRALHKHADARRRDSCATPPRARRAMGCSWSRAGRAAAAQLHALLSHIDGDRHAQIGCALVAHVGRWVLLWAIRCAMEAGR